RWEAALVEPPVEIGMRGLLLTTQRADHGHAVDALRRLRTRELGKRWQQIPVRPRMFADPPRRPGPDPAGDHRNPDAAFVEVALDPAQPARAVEEGGIGTAFLVRAVVAGEEDH